MKRQLLVLYLLFMAVAIEANPVTAEQARQKAVQFLQGQVQAGARRRAPSAKQMRMAAKGRADTYYIFNAANPGDGYVVVSGDDATDPILGYSHTGTIDPDNMPCGLKVLLEGYAKQISFMRSHGITRVQNSRQRKAPRKDAVTSYLISDNRRSYFDQSSPYNDFSHVIDGVHALTGCTATALVGLMYAHKWPYKTKDEIPSYIYWPNPFHKEKVEGVPANTAIDWTNIANDYGNRVYGEDGNTLLDENGQAVINVYNYISGAQRNAIASLMRVAGIAIESTYGIDATGAWIKDIPDALTNYFSYDNHVFYAERINCTDEWWHTTIRNEIMYRGPVIFGGGDANGDRHAFLLDGFNGDYYRVNFGWSGAALGNDSFYLLDVMDEHTVHYYDDQEAVFNVLPVSHDEVEVSSLIVEKGSLTERTFWGENLCGRIYLHNYGSKKTVRFVHLKVYDVEADQTTQRLLITNIAPGETVPYSFSFTKRTIGHHYVLSAYNVYDEEIYRSPGLECIEDPEYNQDEEISGNENLALFEYWFDNDFDGRRQKTLSSNKAVLTGSLSTDHLDDGFHFLYYRLKRNDNAYSGISRSPFLKLSKKEEGYLEYWIDEDEDNKQRLPLDDTEEEQLLTLDLSDNELYPVGFHRLHYQVAVPGSIVGSVQTQAILKLPLGKVTKLEYWFDNNRNAIYEISVNGTESGSWLFANNLNLTGLAPGHHRLYYRAKGADKQLTSAVGMAAIVVNSQFRAEYGDAVLSSFSLSVDGATVVEQGQLNGQKEQEFTYTLDASQLAVGTHTLRASFWNSYGVSVTEQVPFRVSKLGYMKGDVNADGEVDVADAVCIVNHIIGKFVPIFIELAADVNNDNEIDIADAVCIVNYIIGKIPQFSSYSTFAQPMRSVLPKELLEALPEPQ